MFVDIKTTNPHPGVGDKFKVSYILKLKLTGGVASISHNGIKISKPNFEDGFVIIDEGKESSSFGFGSFGSQEMEIDKYSFILQAKKKGTFKIKPLTFTINGNKISSGLFTINVGKGNPNAKIQTSDPNLFSRIEVSKRNIYKGENIVVNYKVYTRYTGFNIEDYDMPMTSGLWKEEIKPGKNGWQQTTQTVNGLNYYVLTLKKEIMSAQKSGDIKLEPFEIKAVIGRSFFNQGKSKTIKSNSPILKIKELPTPKPNNFSNQVGSNYNISIDYSTDNLKTNEPLDIKITISGNGNLKQLTPPLLNLPQDFEIFDPEIRDNIKINSYGISGKKTFQYLVIPRHRGVFEIPEYNFTYFDINSKKYKTLKAVGKTITVEKGENELENTSTPNLQRDKKNVEILNSGIRHIKEHTHLYSSKNVFYNTIAYWVLISTPIFIAIIGFLYIFIIKNNKQNKESNTFKNASKNANNLLEKANILLNNKNYIGFYEQTYKAITDYCSDKLNIPKSKLNKDKIETELRNKNLENIDIEKLLNILNECEMARFSPISNENAEKTLKNVKIIINKIEQNVKY